MDNKRRSKRIEEQSKSPMNEKNNTEDNVARQGRSDIATMRETKELSTKLSLLERKVDSIGCVVYGGENQDPEDC